MTYIAYPHIGVSCLQTRHFHFRGGLVEFSSRRPYSRRERKCSIPDSIPLPAFVYAKNDPVDQSVRRLKEKEYEPRTPIYTIRILRSIYYNSYIKYCIMAYHPGDTQMLCPHIAIASSETLSHEGNLVLQVILYTERDNLIGHTHHHCVTRSRDFSLLYFCTRYLFCFVVQRSRGNRRTRAQIVKELGHL